MNDVHAPTGPEPRLVVGVALVDDLTRPTRILAARRSAPSALAGGWELAGGKVEPGETPLEALHREIREELGIAIEVGPEVPGPLPGGLWWLGPEHVMLVWLARSLSGEPLPLEDHDELRWLPPHRIDEVDWLPADRPVMEAVAARLLAGDGASPIY